jgi:hypothetical protein
LANKEHVVLQANSPSRRLNSRIEAVDGVWVYWQCNGREELSRVLDMSMRGIFIETPLQKPLGMNTKLHFLVEEGQIRADAIVRHVKPGAGMGLRFEAISDADRPHLMALMRRLRGLIARPATA